MRLNLNHSWGMHRAGGMPFTLGKVFFLATASTDAVLNDTKELFGNDYDGVPRTFTDYTTLLAQTVAGRGDVIVISPTFATVPTLAERLLMETNGVICYVAGKMSQDGFCTALRGAAALPASVGAPIFTVTGRIRLVQILGEVATTVQTQGNNTKLTATPTISGATDMCAVLDITGAAVGSVFSITGTLASAMVKTTAGASVQIQAQQLLILPGTIDLNCAATNTGTVKWLVKYQPIDTWASVIPA